MNIGLVSENLKNLSESRSYLIAYSGGVDSHVLLHALVVLRQQDPDIQLRAVHVHHGLSDYADAWQLHCQQVCAQLQVPFVTEKVMLNLSKESVEAAARDARYQIFAKYLQPHECLLTAHSKDDQAETLLLQLLRGAGPAGLSAMPFKKEFSQSWHLRPLLDVTREAIERYAQEQQLHWVEDDSNENLRFDRNYLRHQVMPLLKARWPAVVNNLSRAASHAASAQTMLSLLADNDLKVLVGSKKNTLSIAALCALNPLRRASALRYWLQTLGCRVPSTKQLAQIEKDVLMSAEGAMPVFYLEKGELRRYRDDLYYTELAEFDQQLKIHWDCCSTLDLPQSLGKLLPGDYKDYQALTVCFRQGGEVIKPAGSNFTQSLKKLFQQWGVPPWERDRIPLLYDGDRLVAVHRYCVSSPE